MSREPYEDWLQKKARGLPRLEELSLEGRRAFLERHEPQLWAFWKEAFELELLQRSKWIACEEALAAGRDERRGGEWIAERLIDRLRERPTVEWIHPWTALERWYRWLRGTRAVEARQPEQLQGSDEEDGQWSDGSSEQKWVEQLSSREQEEALLALVGEWAEVLARIVRSTGLASLEVDWLWATCMERRPLALALEGKAVDARFLEQEKKALAHQSSIQGEELKHRLARSRRGAAAAFRFNLEVLVAAHPSLQRAHQVFLGPVKDPVASPARPLATAGPEALEGFREALRLTARRSAYCSPDDLIETLWARVFSAALIQEVARLLTRREEMVVRRDWALITGGDEAAEGAS